MSHDHNFIDEQDLELLGLLARGKDTLAIADHFGRQANWVITRLRLLKALFGATSTPHVVAIAIASDVIRVSDLYDENLACELRVREVGTLQEYHLRDLRFQIAGAQVRWWISDKQLERMQKEQTP